MNTPSAGTDSMMLAERFLGRRLRDGLPTLDDIYEPHEECVEEPKFTPATGSSCRA